MDTRESSILIIDPRKDLSVLKGLASQIRLDILDLIKKGGRNVNDIASSLSLPQSTVATNVLTLEKAGLLRTEDIKGKKGRQKVCYPVYSEMVVRFTDIDSDQSADDTLEVEMPIGLYTKFNVAAPCGLCSQDAIIGFLDVTDSFLDPGRMKAGLVWFEKGYLEYKFPNNSLYKESPLQFIELSTELSSEIPGTNKEWRSDITLWINGVEVGTWTSPGDFGDRRGKFTPSWWKLEGSQYGLLKNWRVTNDGSYVDGQRISNVGLAELDLPAHHSVTVRIGVRDNADRVGGINIFGRGFGNYDQDIILRFGF